MKKMKVTIYDIEESFIILDTEYREALAHSLMELKYLSDSPLNLSFGTEKQKEELKRVYATPLKPKQIKEIISFISNEMKGDFQYKDFKKIALYYTNLANILEIYNKKIGKER